MILQFHIHYKVQDSRKLAIQYAFGGQDFSTVHMQTYDGENWFLSLTANGAATITYKYLVVTDSGQSDPEWGAFRNLALGDHDTRYYYINDFWRSRENISNSFLSTAFTKAIFSGKDRKGSQKSNKKGEGNRLEIYMTATLPQDLTLGITGSPEALGKWLKPVSMEIAEYPLWKISVPLENYDINIQYKYVVLNKHSGDITEWEVGENRVFKKFLPEVKPFSCIIHDQDFRFGTPWKGAGVAIPIFSLRSKEGLGIGEFSDLIGFTDWASSVGLKMIQVLPVNDTIANKTWQDSYPYAAISVFALHPLYVNIEKIGPSEDKNFLKNLQKEKAALNALDQIDFEKVLDIKMKYLKVLYEEKKNTFFKEKEVVAFLKNNDSWLPAYAVFCALRDTYQSCRFDEWPEFSNYDRQKIETYLKQNSDIQDLADFYTFIQYFAHLQLTEARDYARSKGVALKGDLPIGIYRHSCDAWIAPHLYNMDEQAGAPPDDFSVLGQNWGFPTYNWSEMAKDDFSWWKNRMKKLNEYFDVLRIDHILGFFRIWQIPTNQISGTMGLFNPRLPFSIDEIIRSGLKGQIERYTKPFITEELISHYFGHQQNVVETFFEKSAGGMMVFKTTFTDQRSIHDYIQKYPEFKESEELLLKLFSEVIFIEEQKDGQVLYNPRITVHTTYSFQCLSDDQKRIVQSLYNHYYFERHEEFWKNQALWKLPALLDASNMLICGEDLGMIPKSVPGVMKTMNIMSLEIQRMPKGNAKFGKTQEYPYFSVSSPSCHDMSTIRGWWEGDHETAKEYYYNYMFGYGYTPMKAEPRIVQYIVEDHLAGPSMLAIFPLQDLVGIDTDLRRMDAMAEQINEPSNPKHYWRFRFHMNIEDLLGQTKFNEQIKDMIKRYRP